VEATILDDFGDDSRGHASLLVGCHSRAKVLVDDGLCWAMRTSIWWWRTRLRSWLLRLLAVRLLVATGISHKGNLVGQNGRTYQQNLVLDRLQNGLETIEAANDSLESRASKLLAGSTGAIAAISGFGMLPKSIADVGRMDAIFISILCISSLAMIWRASRLWGPQATTVATCGDVDFLYDEYIAKPEDVAFNNVLIDTAKAFNRAKEANDRKSEAVAGMLWVLKVQMAILAVGVLANAFL
jgi:hypothetical protein